MRHDRPLPAAGAIACGFAPAIGRAVEARARRDASIAHRRQAAGRDFRHGRAAWHWQDGGTVEVARRQSGPARPDGLRGRCDAIFSPRRRLPTANDLTELARFRRTLLGSQSSRKWRQFDSCGRRRDAGTCAALSAARLGWPCAGAGPARTGRQQQFRGPRLLNGNIRSALSAHRRYRRGTRTAETRPAGAGNTADIYEDARGCLVRGQPALRS